jgi:hypothetical protein
MPAEYEPDIYRTLNNYLKWHPEAVMINGCAKGVDTICLKWANERGVPVERFPADWDKFGKGAGPVRNKQMLKRLLETKSSAVFAFSNGSIANSKGTKNMIHQCTQAGIEVQLQEFGIKTKRVVK